MFQPRFGLAWDVFGNGKTAVRAGFAKFNQLLRFEPRSATAPISYQPTVYYDNLDTFLSAASVLSPGAVIGHDLYMKAPNTYNLTLGIQQDIGFGTVLETKYVGVLGRNLSVTRNINTLPYGVRFQAENVDPTTSRPFADNFLRPYRGYGDITYRDTGGSSNYHSLQVTANRRLAAGLQFGGAYTYSKTMDYGTLMPLYVAYRTYAYSLADFDQTHNLVINYTYDIPPMSKLVSHPVVKFAFDHWQISGVTRFASGTPSGISVTTTTSADMLGGGNSGQVVDGVSGSTSAQRANVVSDPHLSHGERGLLRMFNTAAFALPAKGDPGNAARMMVRGPGVNNWDMTMFKNFPLRSEQRSVQLRWEFYNLFNHTQFSSMNTTARFDPATGAQTNGQFGQATAARTPRMMQVSLRFRF
jgi:hypothetical protein